ncbi:aldehyde dehydrogenase family protein [Bacillus sp. JJ722]|uniref:aldehyde dehydrogenase family protein n=1 Tax=Bacillus sp. JJ722 TaxID=3122973 RepID=UPI002FFE4C18
MNVKYNKQFINGVCRDGSSEIYYKDINPYSNEVITHIKLGNRDDIDEAYESAKQAQKMWAKVSIEEKKQVLTRSAELFLERNEEIINLLVIEAGSSVTKAHGEFLNTIVEIQNAVKYAERMREPQVFPSKLPGKENRVYHHPVGVIGAISPFNFPLYSSMRVVAPAIAVGNAVVLKPDTQTHITGGSIIADIFEQAGLPKGLLNVITFDIAEVGDHLIEHPIPRVISFTGSTMAGKHIGEICGKHLKRVSLELGGNNPFIVLEDADLEQALNAAVFGKFFHQGQVCVGTNRMFIHRKHYEEFVTRFVDRASQIPYGNPTDPRVIIGPLINENQIQKVIKIVENAKQEGAVLALEGKRVGNVVTPFVFTNVKQNSKLAQTEIFGPAATIIPFDTDAEVLQWANNTEYGLTSAIFTQDIEKGIEFARSIESGMTHLNDTTVNMDSEAPFGGEKSSGIGRYGGDHGFAEFTTTKWVSVQKETRAFPF